MSWKCAWIWLEKNRRRSLILSSLFFSNDILEEGKVVITLDASCWSLTFSRYAGRKNNWPPLPEKFPVGPCFYHDIAVDIPIEYQKTVKIMYNLWMCKWIPRDPALPVEKIQACSGASPTISCVWCSQFTPAHSSSTCLAAWPCSAWTRLTASTLASPCCGSSSLPPVPSSAGTDHCMGPSGELQHFRQE